MTDLTKSGKCGTIEGAWGWARESLLWHWFVLDAWGTWRSACGRYVRANVDWTERCLGVCVQCLVEKHREKEAACDEQAD